MPGDCQQEWLAAVFAVFLLVFLFPIFPEPQLFFFFKMYKLVGKNIEAFLETKPTDSIEMQNNELLFIFSHRGDFCETLFHC